MFQQIPPEVVAAVIESAGEMFMNTLAERKMAAVAELNYELLLLGSRLLDEPWAEGEESENAQRAKESNSSTTEDSDRTNPNEADNDNGDLHIKSEPSDEKDNENEEGRTSPKGASGDHSEQQHGAEVDEGESRSDKEKVAVVKVKTEPGEESSSALPKSRQSENNQSGGSNSTERKMGNLEQEKQRCRSTSRSRGSNVGDSSELEQSETEETDERRISSRRDQDCGSSSRSRTPERPGSDFGGSPGPFSSHLQQQQQQQFLQAGIPYLHLLPPHIRNDAARLFLTPQMLPPELAAVAAAAAAAAASSTNSTSNQSPSPSGVSGSGGNTGTLNTSQTAIPSSSSANSGGGAGKSDKSSSGENSRSGAMFMCEPCNIKFSSARTLEAHQTYYCSFRKDAGRDGVRIDVEDVKGELMMSVPSGSGGSASGSKKRDRENSDEHELTMDESMESVDSFAASSSTGSMNQNKTQKTGKLYSCIFCSYSADKKVSLNRHMRMHSGLSISTNQMPNTGKDDQGQLSTAAAMATALGARPVTPGKSCASTGTPAKNAPESVSALERYCQDCDIQFSSIKTFRVHKQYYCSTRHVLKAQQTAVAAAVAAAAAAVAAGGNPSAALGKAPVELGPGVTVTPVGKSSASITSACSPNPCEASPVSTPGPMSSQPFVVLPTNPIIVVPYCFIQGASFLPGNVLPSHNAIVVLPNGTVQSLPGSANSAPGIPIPVPSPSPQSMILGSHLMMHSPFPTSATPSNLGTSGIMSPSGGIAFPDHKDMMKMMNSGTGKDARDDDREMVSPNKLQKGNVRGSGRSSRSSDDTSSHHEHHHSRSHSHTGSSGKNEVCDETNMPAIDLTFRGMQPTKKEHMMSGGEEEKENQGESCASAAGIRNSRNVSRDSMSGALEENGSSRSATPATSGHLPAPTSVSGLHHHQNIHEGHHHRESISPLEKMSMGSGSGGKRTPRPSSASVSSSCSTPPNVCEPKLNGMMSQIVSPGGKDHLQDAGTALNNKMVMMMLNAGAAAAAAAAAMEGGGGNGGLAASGSGGRGGGKSSKSSMDYSSVLEMTRSSRAAAGSSSSATSVNGGKISPVATQLPGGAILTSATNSQSLAELLMTNPPELNESLAKLNPQLLINAQRAAAAAAASAGSSPVGFNFANLNPAFMQALSPEIAMRLLDPSYLTSLQQSLQHHQQQQQQVSTSTSQTPQAPVKRGVSKCIECDIVFYKYENYLVHKEHYCAARTNNTGNCTNFPSSSKSSGGNNKSQSHMGKGATARDNGTGAHRGGKDACRMSSCSSPSKSELDDEECMSPPPHSSLHRKGSIQSNSSGGGGGLRKSPDSGQSLLVNKAKTKSPQNTITSPVSISPVPSPKDFGGGGVITSGSHNSNNVKDHGKSGGGSNCQYPCSICGVKFSTMDNLQTHQTYYCNNKRKSGNSLGSNSFDNNGDNEFGESKNGNGGNNNGGEALIMGLPAHGTATSPHEKDMMTGAGMGRNKSPGPGCRNGFLRCGKCKLPIPEEQMSTHIRVCLSTNSPSFGNGGRGRESGEIGMGWKCPCCDVYSPTVSAAQKHLETHTGIRAFKCLLCGYRGNTLRGMRTHIRTHFDKRVFDLLEGDYMTCITANDVEPAPPSSASSTSSNTNNNSSSSANSNVNVTSPPLLHPDQIRAMHSPSLSGAGGAITRSSGGTSVTNEFAGKTRHFRFSPENSKNTNKGISASAATAGDEPPSPSPPCSFNEDGSDIKVFPSPSDMMMMTMMTENESANRERSAAENNNHLHYCNLCNYSSPYKGSILKHMKVVHKVQIPLDMNMTMSGDPNVAAAEAAAMMLMHAAATAGDHEGLANMSMMMNRAAAAGAEMAMEDVNGVSGDSSRNSTPKSSLEYAMAQGFSITSASTGKSVSPAAAMSSSEENCVPTTRSRRAAVAAAAVANGIKDEVVIKEKRTSESISTDADRKCSSHSSAEDDITTATKSGEKEQHQHSASGSSPSSSSAAASASGNYCKSCDISFNYVSSFNAHKKFYCSSQVSSDTEAPDRAETPVQ